MTPLYFRPVEPRHFAHWPSDMPSQPAAAAAVAAARPAGSRAASHFPDKPASIFDGVALTYRDLLRRSEALAGHLQRACGVRAGDRVAIDLQNGHDFVLAVFAVLRADAVAVLVSPVNVTEELRYYLADSGARVALTDKALAPRFAGLAPAQLIVMEEFQGTGAAPSPSAAKPEDLCLLGSAVRAHERVRLDG